MTSENGMEQLPGSLAGKTALVTGGGQRIGAAICRELAARGAYVLIHYLRSEKGAIGTRRAFEGGGGWTARVDLADPQGCEWLFREAVEWMGRVDILVNNASIFGRDGAVDAALMRAVNVEAPLCLSRLMAAQGCDGTIIQMLDSRIARNNDGDFSVYAAGKRELAESVPRLAREWAPLVRVNGVAPGPVLAPEGVSEKAGELPLARRPTPQDVAGAVAWLCEASAVSGQILYVDGGQHLLA
ncbi:MAG: SDR family oxidoreductase [Lentisphaerae bacterium]|nr:SDR family oxidoreductase [Lentisphaerota bacterium]